MNVEVRCGSPGRGPVCAWRGARRAHAAPLAWGAVCGILAKWGSTRRRAKAGRDIETRIHFAKGGPGIWQNDTSGDEGSRNDLSNTCEGRHRSISPMTISMLPTMAGMSAMRQPRQISLVTLRLQKLDERARTRKGTASLAGRPTTRSPSGRGGTRSPRKPPPGQRPWRLDPVRSLGRGILSQPLLHRLLMMLHPAQHADVKPVPGVADDGGPGASGKGGMMALKSYCS